MENFGKNITGTVIIKSSWTIEDLGEYISIYALGGLPLTGLDQKIYGDIPAIYNICLGIMHVLYLYEFNEKESTYIFELMPNFIQNKTPHITIDLSDYLEKLFTKNFFSTDYGKIIYKSKEI